MLRHILIAMIILVMVAGPVPSVLAQPQSGGLTVSSTPAGARVVIDGVFRGITPSTYRDLAAGQHAVTLSLEGYLDYHSQARVSAGATSVLDVALQPEPAPTKSPLGVMTVIAVMGTRLNLFRRRRT